MLPIVEPSKHMSNADRRVYNLPANNMLQQGNEATVNITKPTEDNVGCTFCLGPGYIVRCAALDSIEG